MPAGYLHGYELALWLATPDGVAHLKKAVSRRALFDIVEGGKIEGHAVKTLFPPGVESKDVELYISPEDVVTVVTKYVAFAIFEASLLEDSR